MVEVGLATVVTLGIVVESVLGKWGQGLPPDSVQTDNCRGDRTHIGHRPKLDSRIKNSKISFKTLVFKHIILICISHHCSKSHQPPGFYSGVIQ